MRRHLDKRTIHSTMLWLGQMLLSDEDVVAVGGVRIAISSGRGDEEIILRGESERAVRSPLETEPELLDPLVDQMMRSLIGEEERSIIGELTAGPLKGEALIKRTHIERSRFYTLAARLQDRGLIIKADLGYDLSDWLRDALRRPRFAEAVGLRVA